MSPAFSSSLCRWVKWLNGNRPDSYEEITVPAIQYSLEDVLTFSYRPSSIPHHPPPLLSISRISITAHVSGSLRLEMHSSRQLALSV